MKVLTRRPGTLQTGMAPIAEAWLMCGVSCLHIPSSSRIENTGETIF